MIDIFTLKPWNESFLFKSICIKKHIHWLILMQERVDKTSSKKSHWIKITHLVEDRQSIKYKLFSITTEYWYHKLFRNDCYYNDYSRLHVHLYSSIKNSVGSTSRKASSSDW